MLKVIVTLICTLAAGAAQGQDDRPLIRLKLLQDTVISDIRCGPSGRATAAVYSTGELESCPLAVDTELRGHTFPAGTWIYLTGRGELRSVWLAENTLLQGHTCRGTGYQGWSVRFYPSGALQLCWLGADELVDGVPCRKGTFWGERLGTAQVTFHENGHLESCSTSRAFVRDSVQVKKRTRVRLDAAGHLLKGEV
jgi:hypothetical protein